ncbi:PREDICTED: survival motor neuron protein 1-like isoform X1 [Gavialis gangeticus]|uniref:survival motor neuron protein 1-like isoform X1 n=1 Tax=Gavialis gangeticus TaxID=94835 RepID=UPI00092E1F98|nr:PREDICTED: survival motor neuron protein 1-like isoform X1 [Gavialis gangeticus]
MAACVGDIVYRSAGGQSSDCAASDDQALIRAYDQAVRSCKEASGACEDPASDSSSSSSSSSSSTSSGAESASDEEEQERQEAESASQWEVGAACCAVWSGDGLMYPARVVALRLAEGTCVVEYEHYGNREEQSLRDLLPPDRTPESSLRPGRTWQVGDACRVVWLEDGLLYPATVRSVDAAAGTCLVEFDGYGNREEQTLEDLLPPESSPHGNPASKVEEDAHRVPRRPSPLPSWQLPHGRRKPSATGKWAHHLPPLPLPSKLMPPPPPQDLLCPDCEEEDALACMLLSWHLSGYHTGFYMGLRQGRAEAVKSTPKPVSRQKKASSRS